VEGGPYGIFGFGLNVELESFQPRSGVYGFFDNDMVTTGVPPLARLILFGVVLPVAKKFRAS
jgi:hypothetical protein